MREVSAEETMPALTSRDRLDRIGVVASCACAVHCALMPALLGLLPLVGLGWLAEERTEWILVCASSAVGVTSLLPSYLRQHRRASPSATFAGGMALIVAGRVLFEARAGVEAASVVSGAVLVASAHFLNRRLCRSCCAAPSACEQEPVKLRPCG